MMMTTFAITLLALIPITASAQSNTTRLGPLTPEQCKQVWTTIKQSETSTAPEGVTTSISNLAQVDDFAQVDTNGDGIIDEQEFQAACEKGLIYRALIR
jgi:hypothetical protein